MQSPPNRKPIKTHKLRAHRRGRRAERGAIFWLRVKGYRIVVRNLRLPQGEIDVVARRLSRCARFLRYNAHRPAFRLSRSALCPKLSSLKERL